MFQEPAKPKKKINVNRRKKEKEKEKGTKFADFYSHYFLKIYTHILLDNSYMLCQDRKLNCITFFKT